MLQVGLFGKNEDYDQSLYIGADARSVDTDKQLILMALAPPRWPRAMLVIVGAGSAMLARTVVTLQLGSSRAV